MNVQSLLFQVMFAIRNLILSFDANSFCFRSMGGSGCTIIPQSTVLISFGIINETIAIEFSLINTNTTFL